HSLTLSVSPPSTLCFLSSFAAHRAPHAFPTRRSSDLCGNSISAPPPAATGAWPTKALRSSKHAITTAIRSRSRFVPKWGAAQARSEEHTSELQSRENLVCRLLLEKKNG